MATRKISALLLAADSSREPARKAALEILQLPLEECIAVTGFDAMKVERELLDLPLSIARNKNYRWGTHCSIRYGLERLIKPYDGFFVCPADRSFDRKILSRMLQTFIDHDGRRIVVPSFNGERGAAMLIPAHHTEEILRHADGDFDCSYLLEKYPDQTQTMMFERSAPGLNFR